MMASWQRTGVYQDCAVHCDSPRGTRHAGTHEAGAVGPGVLRRSQAARSNAPALTAHPSISWPTLPLDAHQPSSIHLVAHSPSRRARQTARARDGVPRAPRPAPPGPSRGACAAATSQGQQLLRESNL